MYLRLINWNAGEVRRAFLQFSTEYKLIQIKIRHSSFHSRQKKTMKVDYDIEICYCLLDELRTIHQRHQLIRNQD
jgi:hypothetical protein